MIILAGKNGRSTGKRELCFATQEFSSQRPRDVYSLFIEKHPLAISERDPPAQIDACEGTQALDIFSIDFQ